jgi:NAD+ kinase
MNVALFGKSVDANDIPYIQGMVSLLESFGGRIHVYDLFFRQVKEQLQFSSPPLLFHGQEEIRGKADYLFSIGGDGTMLDSIPLVGDSGIPVAGINLGRMGFLSGISKEEIPSALEEIRNRQFILDQRTLLRLETPDRFFGDHNYALNDITVCKNSLSSMLSIRTWVNDEFLNSYWADGLIVATPTGSTAYSLSCTGPIITPGSENFVITPIASHNLTVRPIVIRDDSVIRIQVAGRKLDYSITLDSRIEKMESSVELVIRREEFRVSLIRLKNKNFFNTIREKLKWGLDLRN